MTTEQNGPRRICKDCYPESHGVQSSFVKGPKPRPAPHPGPRCVSHHRDRVKEVRAANHEKRVQETYGLEKGQYAELYLFQGSLCALCRRATGKSRRLSVDHDHATGNVRGLLCRPCNTLLGHARDREDFFERCVDYLQVPPFARLVMGAPFEEYTDDD